MFLSTPQRREMKYGITSWCITLVITTFTVVYNSSANRVLWPTTNRRTCQSNDNSNITSSAQSRLTMYVIQTTGKSCNNANSTLSSPESRLNKVPCRYHSAVDIRGRTDVTWSNRSAVHYERTRRSSVAPVLTSCANINVAIYKKHANSTAQCSAAANMNGTSPLESTRSAVNIWGSNSDLI